MSKLDTATEELRKDISRLVEAHVQSLEARLDDLQQEVDALTLELRAHRHGPMSGAYKVWLPDRTEIAELRGTDGEEMPL